MDDALVEGPHAGTITLIAASTDASYNAIAIANVIVNITDNDVGPPLPALPLLPARKGITPEAAAHLDLKAASVSADGLSVRPALGLICSRIDGEG